MKNNLTNNALVFASVIFGVLTILILCIGVLKLGNFIVDTSISQRAEVECKNICDVHGLYFTGDIQQNVCVCSINNPDLKPIIIEE